ncbi:U8-agatoxin-Ao1a-like [Malaya genurostris]|uniref:U8-agatoxin-Ao1a-like n=1 Tax=Malaya genurostris TaxID=325434 RepID=UPI0026F3E666|nr:U8-agatoxin-Ao1a-like [Malaya genurostris]XP_058451520.1 U8-agatoxin-Ao1a-like [Malaya genurostris]
MNKMFVGRLLICLLIMFVASVHSASSYFYDSEERYPNLLDDEADNTEKSSSDDSLLDNILQQGASKRSSLIQVYRRACIRRGGNCDHRPNDCCYNSSCRCNLWGSNCRCQRMGLFQKWG